LKFPKIHLLQQLEEARESEKNKWLQFNNKTNKKQVCTIKFFFFLSRFHIRSLPQIVKQQSIFQSPDSVAGRVGVGTLGPSSTKPEENEAIKRNIQLNQTKYFIKNTSGSRKTNL
jgi:hypothetical protein